MKNRVVKIICDLLNYIDIELYNEFNLQFEIAYYLRNKGYKVDFERNVSFFWLNKQSFIKKEIDLVVYNKNDKKIAIELKFPTNGQVPEQMFSFIKDIKFLEQLKDSWKFEDTIFLVITGNKNFWQWQSKINKLYQSFRKTRLLSGEYEKPTWRKDYTIKLNNNYKIDWYDVYWTNLKYTILDSKVTN